MHTIELSEGRNLEIDTHWRANQRGVRAPGEADGEADGEAAA
jgi:hypothetical protein